MPHVLVPPPPLLYASTGLVAGLIDAFEQGLAFLLRLLLSRTPLSA